MNSSYISLFMRGVGLVAAVALGIPHQIARLPFLADPGVYDDGEAAVFVWMYFFLHGSVHIEKVYSDVFCQQCIIHRILLYYNLTNKQD